MKKLALLLALFPHAATTVACTCPDTGGAIELSAETTSKRPALQLSNDATAECMQRDREDRCSVYWVTAARVGTVTATLVFADATRATGTIDFGSDDEYPCRGSLRPVHDGTLKL